MNDKVLIVAPHPDDEVLGCGGTIKKLSDEGRDVFVLVTTRGKKELYSDKQVINVRKEGCDAHKILGVKETRFLDYPAPDLDLIPVASISQDINNIIRELNITTIYLPHHGDVHNDHKVIFNAGLVASRPVKGQTVKGIFVYETLSETEWAVPSNSDIFIPTCFVNISDVFSYKLEAMKCYKSQLRDFPNPRSLESIEALANLRGSTVGFTHAEAFMTIRIIRE